MTKGMFITIEGPDGAGKSTVLKKLVERLDKAIIPKIITTREPGGILISEKIRHIILDPKHTEMDDRTEALLYASARRQHLVEKVNPALEQGALVLCDRFVDSSLAYQGEARGIGMKEIKEINDFATNGQEPDLTLYLDIEPELGLKRIQRRKELDRLDQETLAFHHKVREGYLKVLEANPNRVKKIDASASLDKVVETCYDLVKEHYPQIFK